VKKLRALLITCEHGGNKIPERYRPLFTGDRKLLNSHRGYDIGALEAARLIADETGAPLLYYENTRLLIDMNRSEWNRGLFSPGEFSLAEFDRECLLAELYRPYRIKVGAALAKIIGKSGKAVHLAIHSFTPALHGVVRNADIGFLYDSARKNERDTSHALRKALENECPAYRVRMNYPYRGTSDGLTTSLRNIFPGGEYAGIECELNQGLLGVSVQRIEVSHCLSKALRSLF
jgi:predicted N-formylglutamate amidohydrolase